MSRGALVSHVSVVPESTIVPFPEFHTVALTPIDSPPMRTSTSLTVNHPFTLARGTNVIFCVWCDASTPPNAKLPPPLRKQSEKARCLICGARGRRRNDDVFVAPPPMPPPLPPAPALALPLPCSCGTSVAALLDMPMMPSAFCVRKRPVS